MPYQVIAQQTIAEAYKKDLLGQIQAREEARRAERLGYLEEGKRIRQMQQHEKALLEQVSAVSTVYTTHLISW
jgi:hypothetical protein